jgi:type VI secretion system protein ImpG
MQAPPTSSCVRPMSDHLLPYYNRELEAIRQLAAEFARDHPKIAGRLRLSESDGHADDPHVERLLEGAAFLAARVHQRLDDEFPELTDALLGVLYPHYLAPVPSAAIIQLACQPSQKVPVRIPAGRAFDTERVRGESCRFRSTSVVTLWPVEIETVRLSGLPLAAPVNPLADRAQSVLRIALRCADPDMNFSSLGLDALRFFVRATPNVAFPLYELICGHAISVALADSTTDAAPVLLPARVLSQAGFAPEDALLPWPARSFSGFRLLTEYFALPEKFLFFDIARLDAKTLRGAGNRLEIFIYLDRAASELERAVGTDMLALGCTPVANLFAHHCEPVMLTHTTTEYRLEPDVRRSGVLEIWQVERVRETRGDGSYSEWQPFYRLQQNAGVAEAGGFYAVSRRASPAFGGTDLFLTPFDPGFDIHAPADAVLSVDALCTNRDLPMELPFGGGRPSLSLVEGVAAVSRITCLTAPTASLRTPLRAEGFWPLVSHLSLGHLSVVGGDAAAMALREVLRLYDLRGSDETRAAIDALLAVHSAPGVARVPGARAGAFCRGLDVTLEWDAKAWSSGGLFLLASVLERFLALHATVNSFVRTRCVLRGRSGTVAAWPPRAGAQVLL